MGNYNHMQITNLLVIVLVTLKLLKCQSAPPPDMTDNEDGNSFITDEMVDLINSITVVEEEEEA